MPKTTNKKTEAQAHSDEAIVIDTGAIPKFPEHLKLPAIITAAAIAILGFIVFIFGAVFGVDLSRIFF